jgi:Ser/Thr protein kinase RdoA (MazF antagonist)
MRPASFRPGHAASPTAPGLAEAARAYGLDPAALTPVASAYREAAAYRAGSVLLKPWRYGERQLAQVAAALVHLEEQAFTLAPRLCLTQDGRRWAGGWYASTWLDGRRPRFPAELNQAALSLGCFHRAAAGCPLPWPAGRSWRRRWARLLGDLHDCRRRAQSGSAPFDRAYAAAAPAFIRQAETCLRALDACGYDRLEAAMRQTPGFCHRDVTAANLVTDGQGRICLVDPDTWGPELRIHDLAQLLAAGAGENPADALEAVSTYQQVAGPLSRDERALLPWDYLLPRDFWWAGLCRYRRPAPGTDPAKSLQNAITGAPARDACVKVLARELES